jgi:hypothetical protein
VEAEGVEDICDIGDGATQGLDLATCVQPDEVVAVMTHDQNSSSLFVLLVSLCTVGTVFVVHFLSVDWGMICGHFT